jgi:hypothetical protein
MEDVAMFYGRLVYLTAIWYILWPFGVFYGHLVHFPALLFCAKKKSGNPDLHSLTDKSDHNFRTKLIHKMDFRSWNVLIFGFDPNSTSASAANETWDRFYKTPFRPKTFRINFHPKLFLQISTQK